MQRRLLALVAVGVVVLSAGCGFLLGLESLTFSSSPIAVSDQAVQETGYEEAAVGPQNESVMFSVFGQNRTVEVTNHVGRYERSVDLGPLGSQRAATFVALSSPEIEVAGNTVNPIQNISDGEILERVGARYESVSVEEQTGTRTAESLGDSRTLTRFNGTATLEGTEIPVFLETARFKHGSDYVVVVAVYPQDVPGEAERVGTLFAGLDHTADTEDDG